MNKVIVCGRTTAEPDVRMTQSGKKVCQFTLAIDDGANKDGSRRTQFIDCEAWEKSAEFMERFVKKGLRILVEGRLSKRMYEKDGVKHYPTNVIAERVEFADSLKNANSQQNEQKPMAQQNRSQNAQNQPYTNNDDFGISGIDINMDDLPF